MEKPFSPACERNKGPLLEVLQEIVSPSDERLLEIGSGTGQHAVSLAPHFDHLVWVTSDVEANHGGIKMWLKEAKIPNIEGPVALEIGKDKFPRQHFDLVFTANTFHIMSWKLCKTLMKMLGENLSEGAQVLIYGPFNYQGQYTSPSNEEFDRYLKSHNPLSGIRSFEDVKKAMEKNGFFLGKDFAMPANNRTLVFTKIEIVK